MTGSDAPVLLIVPIAPDATGNGLAMRAGMWLEALAETGAVDVVVVPVSGAATPSSWARALARRIVTADVPNDAVAARSHTTMQLADPVLRERLQRCQPLPARARLAPPTLADGILDQLPGLDRPVVVVMRDYLAPLGLWIARRHAARRVVVDLDDDSATMAVDGGDHEGADALERLLSEWLPDADAVFAASPAESSALADRLHLPVSVAPNAIRLPDPPAPAPARDRLLFVGNLTYDPNVDAARVLVDDVLPALRGSVPGATVTLVGAYDDRLAELVDRPGVTLTGWVDDVGEHYAGADVVVVPLRTGAGTRIKVLEAMAHRRPVVATPTAVAGLGLGREEVAIAGLGSIADVTLDVLRDAGRRSAMVEAAFATVAAQHTVDAVAPALRRSVHESTGGDGVDDPRGAGASE